MTMAHMVILSETVSRVTYCPQKCHINPRMSWDVLGCLGISWIVYQTVTLTQGLPRLRC